MTVIRAIRTCLIALAAIVGPLSAAEPPRVVPAPILLEPVADEPIQLGLTGIVLAGDAPDPHRYIAEQIRGDLSRRFGVHAMVLGASEDRSACDSFVVLGEPPAFELLKGLCAGAGQTVDADRPGREGYVLGAATLDNKPAIFVGGSDAKGVVNGGFAFVQLPVATDGAVLVPRVLIVNKPELSWRGPALELIRSSDSTRLTVEDRITLDWVARAGYSAIGDRIFFTRDIDERVRLMIDEAHRRGLKYCVNFSIEIGGGYIDVSDAAEIEAFRRRCNDAAEAGADMLGIGFGDIPGDLSPGEKKLFQDKFEKCVYVFEEVARIATRHGIGMELDGPYYFHVGYAWPAAIRFEEMVAASPHLKEAHYIHTLTGGFDETRPDALMKALRHLHERGLRPAYWFNGIRRAFGPTGGYQPHYSGAPRYGMPTVMDLADVLGSGREVRAFPYFEQTYINPKAEDLRDIAQVVDHSWLKSSGHFQMMLHAAWSWSPRRFDESRERRLILDRLFGRGGSEPAEQWQRLFARVLTLVYPEVGRDEFGNDEKYRHAHWYDQGYRCYRAGNGTKIRTRARYREVEQDIRELGRLRLAMARGAVTGEVAPPDALVELDRMAYGESFVLRDAAGFKTSGVLPLEDLDRVGQLLRDGVDIDAGNRGGRSPLLQAAVEGRTEALDLLITFEADLDARDPQGRTALHLAAEGRHAGMVLSLLNNGADPDARDRRGRTALHLAAVAGSLPTVEALLNHAADPGAADDAGRTPLHALAATYHADQALVGPLLAHGAAIDAADNEGQTPAHLAASRPPSLYTGDEKPPDVLAALVGRAAGLETASRAGRTPLHLAASVGRHETVAFLIDKGAQIPARDRDGRTPLHLAAARGRMLCVSALLEKGADPESTDTAGRRARDHAAANGHDRVVALLGARESR